MKHAFLVVIGAVVCHAVSAEDLPAAFDLRDVDGKNYVSAVKNQSGGTCWTHGTMAAIESNLLRHGGWEDAGETGDANLAEYHLDWWNGFNQHHNADIAPATGGLTVHQGGDYLVAAAYMARGGATRDVDAQSFGSAPPEYKDTYHRYYARHIEWFDAGADNSKIDRIKQAIVDHGVIGTALAWSTSFFNSSSATFYQPPSSGSEANHAVAIVGWDDAKKTAAPKPGAWLVKNSWGTSWGKNGYFWISYFDKVSTHHADMGAVSFRDVEPLRYDHIYFHDYHGWRDTKKQVTEAFNAFTAETSGGAVVRAVSFYTAEDGAEYRARVFGKFENGELSEELTFPLDGVFASRGLHTVDLDVPITLQPGQKFYVALRLSKGGQAFDRTSDVPVLLGGGSRATVKSAASEGESFYRTAQGWKDLTDDDDSANFCIKALATDT